MLLKDLREETSLAVHDPDFNEITKSQWTLFFRSAGMDARSSGWLLDVEDDESLTVADNTFNYAVPNGFAYIDSLMIEETSDGNSVYVREIPSVHYDIRLDGGKPVFAFVTLSELNTGKHIKVIGQARPTIYTDENQQIDRGMETFIRERALYFAFRFLGAGLSELARWRQQMATYCFQTSEAMLSRHPQEFRSKPSSRAVPGRG